MQELKIANWHAHLYFPTDKTEEVRPLTETIANTFGYDVGTIWDKPVGPHPIGSCQITVPANHLDKFLPWLMINRGNWDVFLHPNTGNDLLDHQQNAMWLGKSYPLKLEIFK